MIPLLTPLYAGLLALIFVVLSWRVILYRRANLISLGDSGDKALLKRMRAQANCAEYAPVAIILMLLAELSGAPGVAVHTLGIAFVTGRILHAIGFSATPQKIGLRQIGMVLTLMGITFSALGLILHGLI
ncbi:Membrane-associated protein in eicosanoid and glutathione metabolism [Sulfitobacter noctilucae]|nr:MAPEG family protein [Sulfitobacter noctilucae]KIN60493.1 Membrane-associated protein in eicosanoid and glutathione metabolism [Sulfitobacter noctilucae]